MLIKISLSETNTYRLWYNLRAKFSRSAVIQSIISYLNSKKKTLHVMLILYDVKLFIFHFFDVQKEIITSSVSQCSDTPYLQCYLVPWSSRVVFLIGREKRKHYMWYLFYMTSNCLLLIYLTSNNKTLQVGCPTALIYPTCNGFLFGGDPRYYFLFDVKKEIITSSVSQSSCTPYLQCYLIRRSSRVVLLIWRQKRKHYM